MPSPGHETVFVLLSKVYSDQLEAIEVCFNSASRFEILGRSLFISRRRHYLSAPTLAQASMLPMGLVGVQLLLSCISAFD